MSTVLQGSQATRRARATWSSDHEWEGAWERTADEFVSRMDEEDDDGKWDDEPDWEDDAWEWEDDDEDDDDDDDDEDDEGDER